MRSHTLIKGGAGFIQFRHSRAPLRGFLKLQEINEPEEDGTSGELSIAQLKPSTPGINQCKNEARKGNKCA